MIPLSLSVKRPDGFITRWGPGEPDGENIPGDLTFGTSIPGGNKDLTCSLLRRGRSIRNDQALFDDVRVYGPGQRTLWEGRMAQFPQSQGQSFIVNPGAVGWSAHLRDNPSFLCVFIDRDPSAWRPFNLARRDACAAASRDMGIFSAEIGSSGIIWALPNQLISTGADYEVFYDGVAGQGIATMKYRGKTTGTTASIEAPGVWNSSNENGAFTGPNALTLDDTDRSVAMPAPTQRYAMMRMLTSAAVTPAVGTTRQFSKLGMIGNHGLTEQVVQADFPGFWASDMIAYVVRNNAPLLNFTTGPSGSIVDSPSFVVPHAAFKDPVTGEDAISFLNGYHLYEWGVYENKQFFWRPTDPSRLLWEARIDRGSELDNEGDTAEEVFNGVFVTYTDPTGVRRTVGPPGGAFDTTSALLADTSANNPVNAHQIPARWGRLDVSFITTAVGAIQLGYVWLAEHSLPARRGSLVLKGTVTHPREGEVSVARVRAGDYVTVADFEKDVPRRIIETRYNHADGGTNQLTLDNTVFKLDAILERIGVQFMGVA